jgi:hypothetical protein
MGKRELVLIAVFVVLGIGLYEFTAPPPPPGSEGVSLSGIFRNIRRTVHGSRDSASADSAQTAPVDANVKELRVNFARWNDMTVAGEDRTDVAAEMHATARGFNPTEAKAAAEAFRLKLERVGDALVVSLDNSSARALPRNGNIGQLAIGLKVPRRLTLRMEPHIGRLIAGKLAGAEIMGSRGETRVTEFTGRVVLTHNSGALDVEDVPSLKLNARNSRGTVKRVGGPMAVDTIGGELTISDVAGPLEIEGRNTDLRIDGIKGLKAPLRINTSGGEMRIEGLRTEARIDGRNSNIDVTLDAAAPITIYNLGAIRVTAPPGGYTLDAVTTEGRINMDDGDVTPSEGADPHAAGPVRGGGPTLTLRATRGSVTIRKPAGK